MNRDVQVTAALRAKAGWLWTKRQGLVAGFSAAAMHGSQWVDDTMTVELIHENRHRLPGLLARGDRIEEDEIDHHRRCAGNYSEQDGAGPRLLVSDDERGCCHRLTGPCDGDQNGRRRALGSAVSRTSRYRTRAPCNHSVRCRSAVPQGDVVAAGSDQCWITEAANADSSTSTRQAARLHISTWVGRTSKSRSSTTVNSTAPTDTNTTGTCGDRKYFTDSAGPSFVSWQVIGPRRSFDGSSPP